jgi:hypothetical protein
MSQENPEARCTEATALRMKEGEISPMYATTFQAALGIPLVISEEVPDGRVQFWMDGKMVREIVL